MAKIFWLSALLATTLVAGGVGSADAAIRKSRPAAASPSPSPVSTMRKVVLHIDMSGKDDEGFLPPETTKKPFDQVFFLSPSNPTATLSPEFIVGWGGECRAELGLTLRLNPDDTISVTGMAKLFEGTTESTTNLKGREPINWIIPASGQSMKAAKVKNTEDVSTDSATYNFTFEAKPQ